MPKFVDLSNQKFGRWTAMERTGTKGGGALWLCKCDCGNVGEVRSNALRTGKSKSCGCYNKEVRKAVCIERNTTHGMSGTRTYTIWDNMKYRDKTKPAYKDITVCPEWSSFEAFLGDMGQCPSDFHTIDRIDNAKGYEPSNCRWATMKEQQNNRTNNVKLTAFGKTQNLQQWADDLRLDRKTISDRIKRGWTPERALSIKPVRGRNQYS
ncbi:hypothetical protein OAA60_03070 [Porticoccaceae bacterium]|nr:hypothetical protein [Porticoccaceae bacterium]